MNNQELLEDLRLVIHSNYPQYKDKVEPLRKEQFRFVFLAVVVMFPFWLLMIGAQFLFTVIRSLFLKKHV